MPDGYCEDVRVNRWNDAILAQVCAYPGLLRGPVPADVDLSKAVLPDPEAMRALFDREPYAIKDPRFWYTYPVWKPLLKQPCVGIVLFRSRAEFVASALKLRADWPDITDDAALLEQEWASTYEHIRTHDDRFVYINFCDLIDGSALPVLEALLGYPIVRDYIRPK